MWRRLGTFARTQLAVMIPAVMTCMTLAAQTVLAAPETIHTNSRQFDIPFVLGETTQPDEAPVEVQLHVSTDGGVTWRQHGAVGPQVGMFRYLSAQDGAYLFSLRSKDAAGRLHPPRPPEAELIVVVDTVAPSIALDARPAPNNMARVNWSIVEGAIAAETIRIEYQSADTSVWTPVELPIAADKPLEALAGEVNVQLPATTAEIRFRAVASDRGGNQATAEVTVPATTPALSPIVAGQRARNGNQSLATGDWRDRDSNNPRTPIDERGAASRWTAPQPQSATTLTARRFPRYDPPPAVGGDTLEELPQPLAATTGPVDQFVETLPTPPRSTPAPPSTSAQPVSSPFDTPGDQGVTHELPAPPDVDSSYSDHGGGDQHNSNDYNSNDSSDNYGTGDYNTGDHNSGNDDGGGDDNGDRGRFEYDAEVHDVEVRDEPPAPSDRPPRSTLRQHDDGDRLPSFLPSGERPLVVDTLRFEIEYEIETIGPSGVDRVELWGTADGGRTWEVFAVDDDNESPLVISAGDEGVYGFRIVVVDVAGLSGVAPQAGDLPEMWVAVDLTEPDAEIADVEAVPSAGQGEMTVHWTASDMMLAARPVTLSYGETASGPWSTIAAGLDNTSRFDWQPTADVPDDVFVRLEVRDEAGNIREYVTAQPVHLPRMRPKARLRSVRPAA